MTIERARDFVLIGPSCVASARSHPRRAGM
jgi:hypothetical protein